MVHQRDEADIGILLEVLEMLQHVVGRDFAAQVEEVLGAQAAFLLGGMDRIRKAAHLAHFKTTVLVGAHPQAIENGRDAGRGDLRVMGLDGRRGVPANARTRRVVLFQVVGMQFDQTRDEIVAFDILAGSCGPFGDIGDLAITDQERAGKDLVVKDDAGVREDGLGGHGRIFLLCAGRPSGRQL